MTKQQFIDYVATKKGFISIAKDALAPDDGGDVFQKRFLLVNTENTSGTAGQTYCYYVHDTVNDEAKFYNVEPEFFDFNEKSTDQKKLDALMVYLKSNFNAYFIIRYDLENQWAEADTYKLENGKLTKKAVIVFKQGTNPITHLEIA